MDSDQFHRCSVFANKFEDRLNANCGVDPAKNPEFTQFIDVNTNTGDVRVGLHAKMSDGRSAYFLSDSPLYSPGWSVERTLDRLVECGVPRDEALRDLIDSGLYTGDEEKSDSTP